MARLAVLLEPIRSDVVEISRGEYPVNSEGYGRESGVACDPSHWIVPLCRRLAGAIADIINYLNQMRGQL
jgi:hypothetical protein